MDSVLQQLGSFDQAPSGSIPVDSVLAQLGAFKDSPPKMQMIGSAGLPQAVREVAGNFNPLSQFAVGTKAAFDSAALRLKQLMSKLSPEDLQTLEANRA